MYRCALAVTLKRRSENLELLTSEIGFAGAFIRTTESPPLNSLVRLLFTLPPDGQQPESVLDISAHVTNVIKPDTEADHYPGFAARFVALNGPVKRRWEGLVQSLRTSAAASRSEDTIFFARASYVMRLQEREPTAVAIPLQPATFEELSNIIEQQIPTGMFFVPTTTPVMLGANVHVQIVHPITNEILTLSGSVVRRGTGTPGALVRLRPLDGDMRAALKEFEESVLVLVDYDVELFDDPVISTR